MRNLKCLFFFVTLLGACAVRVEAQRVGIRQGNVYFVDEAERSKQLTSGGLDSSPFLSSDQRQVVFVRDTPGRMVATGSDDQQATELYTVGVDGEKLSLLLRGKNSAEMSDILADFEVPQFSPDNKSVYFLGSAWTTSGSIHNLISRKLHPLVGGEELRCRTKFDFAS